ncbi:MAG TPA: hypothetical protein DD379_09150 [Cyanobacteria bacterium UBA11162]|nr:hypothetical protein [Cyanobacteria bacterium UBA11162]
MKYSIGKGDEEQSLHPISPTIQSIQSSAYQTIFRLKVGERSNKPLGRKVFQHLYPFPLSPSFPKDPITILIDLISLII